MESAYQWLVYILEAADGEYYSGITWRAHLAMVQAKDSLARDFLSLHKLKRIIKVEGYSNLLVARARESYLDQLIREKRLTTLLQNQV